MVLLSDAVAHPGAVVVEPGHALVTHRAVLRPVTPTILIIAVPTFQLYHTILPDGTLNETC